MEKQSKKSKSKKSVKAVPEGMHTVTPYLVVDDAHGLIRFIEQAFGGKTTAIMKTDDGTKVMHANVEVGDSAIMVTDSNETYKAGACRLYLYVEDVDKVYQQALQANGSSLREPTDEFYGDRSCGVKDSWGNEWWIATHFEDLTPEEMKQRMHEKMEEPDEVGRYA